MNERQQIELLRAALVGTLTQIEMFVGHFGLTAQLTPEMRRALVGDKRYHQALEALEKTK